MITYEDIHWGDRPGPDRTMHVWFGTGRQAGRALPSPVKHLSYSSKKAGVCQIFKHPLDVHDGSRPYLVVEHGQGKAIDIEKPDRDLQVLGRAIDVELANGERIMLGGCYVVTDAKGRVVMLASPHDLAIQIEQRGAVVTERGIER